MGEQHENIRALLTLTATSRFEETTVLPNAGLNVAFVKNTGLAGSEYWSSKTKSAFWIEDEYSELYGMRWRPGSL